MIQSRVKQIKEAKAVQHIPCLLVEAKPIVTINQNPSTNKWRDAIDRVQKSEPVFGQFGTGAVLRC